MFIIIVIMYGDKGKYKKNIVFIEIVIKFKGNLFV